MSWFRAKPAPLSAAERLRGRWRCASCDAVHEGLLDLAAFAPDPWPGEELREPNSNLRLDGNFLSEDFCVMDGRYFFVRGVLEIPVHGFAEKFGFGCWSTLSRENFEKYVEGFDDGVFADWGPWSGWLGNRLGDYIGTEPEAVWVYPQPHRQRPTFRIMDSGHPLAIDQEKGITPERLLAIFEQYGHAIEPPQAST
jgi:hypothetical protein